MIYSSKYFSFYLEINGAFQGEKSLVNKNYHNIQKLFFVSSGYDSQGAKLGVSKSIFQTTLKFSGFYNLKSGV